VGCWIIQIDFEAKNVFTFNGQVNGHLVIQEHPAVLLLLFSDTIHSHVQTFQHHRIIMTLQSGAYRKKLEVDNTGSINIKISLDSVRIPTRCTFVIEFVISKFIKDSTCFERHTAHHREP
jgi:hypothetical protein